MLPGARAGLIPHEAFEAVKRTLRGTDASGNRVTAPQVEQAIQDFAAAGTAPSVGQATGGRFAQAMETMLGNVPGGAGPVARLANQQREAAADHMERLSNQVSSRGRAVTSEQAGRSIAEGIEGQRSVAFVPRTARKADELYAQVGQQIPPNTRVTVENTKSALADLNASIEGAPNVAKLFQNARIQGIGGALAKDAEEAGDGLPYQALSKLRTLVGRELDNYSLADSVPRDKWKTLYGALTRDMEAAAATSPQAQQAWSRANAYYAARAKRIDAIAHVVDKRGGPEAVYRAAFGNTTDGATTLHAVMQSLPKESQRDLTASFIRRMGRATNASQNAEGDAFSMETFLTNWAKLSPEAKRVLFDRHGFGFRQDVEKIARMADRIRQGSGVFKNPSGTGRLISLITQSAGTASSAASALVAGNPLLASGIVAGSAGLVATLNGLGRLMTSPGFVRWVAQNGERPVGELTAQLQTLRQIAKHEDNDDVSDFAAQLEASQRSQGQDRRAPGSR